MSKFLIIFKALRGLKYSGRTFRMWGSIRRHLEGWCWNKSYRTFGFSHPIFWGFDLTGQCEGKNSEGKHMYLWTCKVIFFGHSFRSEFWTEED